VADNQKAGTIFGDLYQFAEDNNITVVGGFDPTLGPSGGWVTASLLFQLDSNRVLTFIGREAVIVCSRIYTAWEPIVYYNTESSLRKGNISSLTLAKIPTSFMP
jgi:hypothetical protein